MMSALPPNAFGAAFTAISAAKAGVPANAMAAIAVPNFVMKAPEAPVN